MSLAIGLTGGIGSGKSTVADSFALLGVAIVDTDAIAHELTTAQGCAMPEITAVFGACVLRPDGGLDRTAMRRLVFSDASAKNRLEAILHPLIRRESETRCQAVTGAPYVLLVVPLLVENDSYRQLVDRVLVVDCDESVQVSRVMARSGLARDEVSAIMAAQASRAERLAMADDLIDNSEDRENLKARIAVLHKQYVALATAKHELGALNANC